MSYPYWPKGYVPQYSAYYWPIRHYRFWPGDEGYKMRMGGKVDFGGALQSTVTGPDVSDNPEAVKYRRIGTPRPRRVVYPK